MRGFSHCHLIIIKEISRDIQISYPSDWQTFFKFGNYQGYEVRGILTHCQWSLKCFGQNSTLSCSGRRFLLLPSISASVNIVACGLRGQDSGRPGSLWGNSRALNVTRTFQMLIKS